MDVWWRYFTTGKKKQAIIAPDAAGNDATLANRLLLGLGTPRITPKNMVTITGTVVGVAPHYAPDGDMVFALKPDPPNDNLVNAQNKAQSKMAGGIWCEGMCQQGPKNLSQPWHKGDCIKGGPFPKFTLPNVGDKLLLTGFYAIYN